EAVNHLPSANRTSRRPRLSPPKIHRSVTRARRLPTRARIPDRGVHWWFAHQSPYVTAKGQRRGFISSASSIRPPNGDRREGQRRAAIPMSRQPFVVSLSASRPNVTSCSSRLAIPVEE